jgi:hypothetical protein
MRTKPFNQAVHDACDPPAREAVSKYIKATWGMNAWHNPNQYAVDLIIEKDKELIGYAEIEMRDWDHCPFKTIHIPKRKDKLFNNNKKTIYFVVSRGMERAWYIDSQVIKDSAVAEIPNKAVSQGEYFYDVPTYLFTEVNL